VGDAAVTRLDDGGIAAAVTAITVVVFDVVMVALVATIFRLSADVPPTPTPMAAVIIPPPPPVATVADALFACC
jgi:hypothetical protein